VRLADGGVAYDQTELLDETIAEFERVISETVPAQKLPLPTGDNARFELEDVIVDSDLRAKLDNFPYVRTIGQLAYVAQHTRIDLSQPVSELSGYLHTFGPKHIACMKHLIGYVKATREYRLEYHKGSDFILAGASDASFAADRITRKSRSGVLIFVYLMPVYWSSRRQKSITLSSMEAETTALTHCSKEIIWIRRVLNFLGFDMDRPTPITVDNKAAISFAETARISPRTKHIALKHFFNKEHIQSGEIAPVYVPTEHELADVLTKNPTTMFDEQIKKLLGLVPKENLTKYLKEHQTSYDKLQSRRVRAVE